MSHVVEPTQAAHLLLLARVIPAIALSLLGATGARAVPSMERQTGMQCATCHTAFPELTPFGRQFKLSGYSLRAPKGADASFFDKVPIAGLLQASRTATRNTATDGAAADAFPRDRETIAQAVGLYYGGRIVDNLGALVQYNYDGIERKWGMEMFDMRYGNSTTVAGKGLLWGVSMNNAPTVSDIYNSTPTWGFPHTDSAAVMPAASTMIDMTLASQVGGVTAFGLLGDTLYVEAGAYRTASKGFFRFMGLGVPTDTVVKGQAPYWRLALQKQAGAHSFEVGTFGMVGKILADSADPGIGTNRFRDVALDAQYQFITEEHQVSSHAAWIREKQDWNASFDQGMSSSRSTALKTFRADLHYYFRRKYGGGVQYFETRGDANDLRYNTGEPVMGSANGSPNNKGWVAELSWYPVDYVKLAVRYTAYQQFNGGSTNYDGFGRNAKDNNPLFLLAWVLF